MTELSERLQAALGTAYRVEKKLGGGMSRVFVAEETRLTRRVVIKTPLWRDSTRSRVKRKLTASAVECPALPALQPASP